jgi:hypothetical protein
MLTLVKETKGMWGQEIAEAVDTFKRTGHVGTKPRFGCRDPISAMFVEFDFNPYHLSRFIEVRGFHVSMRPLPPYEAQHPLLHSVAKTMLQHAPHSLASLFYYIFPKFEIVAERNETIKALAKIK